MSGKPRKLAAAASSVSVRRIGVVLTWRMPSRRSCPRVPVVLSGEGNRIHDQDEDHDDEGARVGHETRPCAHPGEEEPRR